MSYLGTNASSSDSQFATARFFPAALVGDGLGGGVIFILWRKDKNAG